MNPNHRYLIAGGIALLLTGAAIPLTAVAQPPQVNNAVNNAVNVPASPSSSSTSPDSSFSIAPGDQDQTINETVEGIYDGTTFTPVDE